jgi:hypothetical protein
VFCEGFVVVVVVHYFELTVSWALLFFDSIVSLCKSSGDPICTGRLFSSGLDDNGFDII